MIISNFSKRQKRRIKGSNYLIISAYNYYLEIRMFKKYNQKHSQIKFIDQCIHSDINTNKKKPILKFIF
jgi:hypothetical protein